MVDKALRKVKEKMLTLPAHWLSTFLSPVAITSIGLVVGLGSCWFVLQGQFVIAFILWIVNRFADGVDGIVARLNNQATDFGGYLDIVFDFIIYACIPIAFVVQLNDGLPISGGVTKEMWAMAAMLALFYINAAGWIYLSAILEKRKQGAKERGESTTVSMPDGIVEGTEGVVSYSLLFIFPHYVFYIFVVVTVLTFVTVIQRIVWAAKHLHS
jgi:phosphatidylglycerophosphate synthase